MAAGDDSDGGGGFTRQAPHQQLVNATMNSSRRDMSRALLVVYQLAASECPRRIETSGLKLDAGILLDISAITGGLT